MAYVANVWLKLIDIWLSLSICFQTSSYSDTFVISSFLPPNGSHGIANNPIESFQAYLFFDKCTKNFFKDLIKSQWILTNLTSQA